MCIIVSMEAINDQTYFTIEEVATLLKVHYNTAYKWVTTGVLPAAKIGDSWRVKKSDIDAFWEKGKTS